MEEIKVGEYIRTKDGFILKVINVNEFRPPESKYAIEASYLTDIRFIGDYDIAKHSPNIIDLIRRLCEMKNYRRSNE